MTTTNWMNSLGVVKTVDVPYHLRRLRSVDELLGELFVWEFAVALSGMSLDIYPFDQPDVESAKKGPDGSEGGGFRDATTGDYFG